MDFYLFSDLQSITVTNFDAQVILNVGNGSTFTLALMSICYIPFSLWLLLCFLSLGRPCSTCTFPGPDLESVISPRRTDPPPVFSNYMLMVLYSCILMYLEQDSLHGHGQCSTSGPLS